MEFLQKLKKELRPDDSVLKEANSLVSYINKLLRKEKIKAECIEGGSVAKGTYIKDDYDIDLFVIFDKENKGKDISKLLGKALKPLKPKKIHGSRDYFNISKNSLNFEIVPVLKVSNYKEAENVTDMSPLHVKYFNKKANRKTRDEVRLAKSFCKAHGIYGAESYIKGFSGHIIDILIIYYGSFIEFLKNASRWKDKEIIDPLNHWKDPLFELNKSKTRGPLVIVDPVQPNRNAAAALSRENYEILKKKSKEFLKKPSESFFVKKKINIDEFKKRAGKDYSIVLDVKTKKGKEDIVGSKTKKAFDFFSKALKNNDFDVLFSDWEWNKKQKAKFYFIIKKEKLSDEMIHSGPPLDKKEHVDLFRRLYKKTIVKKKRIYAKVKRKYLEPKKLISDLIKDKYINDRVQKITIK